MEQHGYCVLCGREIVLRRPKVWDPGARRFIEDQLCDTCEADEIREREDDLILEDD